MLKKTLLLSLAALSLPALASEQIRYVGQSTRTDTAGLDCELVITLKTADTRDTETDQVESVSLVGTGRDWNHYDGAAERQLATIVRTDPDTDFNQLGFTFRGQTFEALSSRAAEMVYRPDGLTYATDENIKIILKGGFSEMGGVDALPAQIDKALATHEVFSEAKGLMARSTVECASLFRDQDSSKR